jgi:uncharacterized membrane protein
LTPPPTAPGAAEAQLAGHVTDSVETVADFRLEHYRAASRLQRGIDRLTDGLGRPLAPIVMVAVVGAWAAATALAGGGGVNQPSFAWLELAGTVAALLVSILILVTQRREDQLAERQSQLILQLALLSDKKSAKIIALLEELRRDQPDVADRIDEESNEMATPADPRSVLAAIDERASPASPA